MTHPRKSIRDYAIAQLNTITGLSVDSQTLENVAQNTLPAARVMITNEEAEQETQSPPQFMSDGVMLIQVRATGTTSVDTLDDLSEQIVPLMLADVTYGGICEMSNYRGLSLELNENTNDVTINLQFSYRYMSQF